MDTLLHDIRFGWRLLRRRPGFTVAAVLALAIGIGATTAIFSILDRVVLRPLPYSDPDRLVTIWDVNVAKGLAHERLSPVTFLDYRALGHVFADGAGWWYPQVNLTETGKDPMRISAIEASGNFFAFQQLVTQDPGFRPDRIVTVNLELPYRYEDFRKIADFYGLLLTSVRQQPGVSDAGLANFLPLTPGWRLRFLIEGRPQPAAEDAPQAQHQSVDESYFKIIGVPLLAGRFFDPRDTADAPGVVIVNQALARREWPNDNPLGQHITTGVRYIGPMGTVLLPPTAKYEVIGVVGNVKNASLADEPEPAIYFSFRQFSFRGFNLVVKGQGDASALSGAIRSALARLDPSPPLSSARPLDALLADATDRPRALMMLMGLFAALALGLSALGIYSVLSYAVNQRQQELSVRMALGACPQDLLWLVVRQGMVLTSLGGAIGAAGAVALGRTISSLLFGVRAGDPAAFAVALGVALVTAFAACWLPARRAAATNPVEGLRI
jgi:putative ABC transport system permease protein